MITRDLRPGQTQTHSVEKRHSNLQLLGSFVAVVNVLHALRDICD